MNTVAKSKRMHAIRERTNPEQFYTIDEAIALVLENATAKFDETIDIAMMLNVDVRQADQQVRGMMTLPNGTGKSVRVAVFARGEAAEAAEKVGADAVGAEDLAEQFEKGDIPFDRIIATPDMMPIVGRLGKVLGPKGLMPNPKLGTVTPKPAKAVEDAKAGALEYRAEKGGILHAGIGKKSFGAKKLTENLKAFLKTVENSKPSGVKGIFVKKISISSTMGAGVKLDLADALGTQAQAA